MISSQLRKRNLTEGKKKSVPVRYNAKSRLKLLASDASSILASTKTELAVLILHPVNWLC